MKIGVSPLDSALRYVRIASFILRGEPKAHAVSYVVVAQKTQTNLKIFPASY
jgi:hypothetical protein